MQAEVDEMVLIPKLFMRDQAQLSVASAHGSVSRGEGEKKAKEEKGKHANAMTLGMMGKEALPERLQSVSNMFAPGFELWAPGSRF